MAMAERAGNAEIASQTNSGDRKAFVAGRDISLFALFLALAVIALLPGSLHPGEAIIGFPGDSFQHAWFLWHFARAVSHGQNPYYTNLIFYPNRVNLAWSTLDPLAAALALPFSLTLGPIAAYNISLILQLALAAFFAYLLCLRICGNVVASVIGGICFGFSPWLMGEALGHLSLATAFPIPLYFLALDDVLRRRPVHWKNAVTLGLALFLTALAHYNYTVFCALLTVVIVCVDLALEGLDLAAKIWKPLAVAAVTFAICFLPIFLSMWANPAERPTPRSANLIEGHSADLFGWFVPSWNHMVFGRFARGWNLGLFGAGYEGIVYLGPVILGLALIGFLAARRSNRRWAIRLLATALVFWALSLGPHIRVWGHQTGLPGPAFLLYASVFGRFVSAPARFHVIAMLCFAALAAMGVAALLKLVSRRKWRIAIVVGISAALAIDLLTLPFPVATSAASARHPDFAIRIDGCTLPADVSGATVVTVPELRWPYPVRAMWMQIADGGRYSLTDGYVSYGPGAIWSEFWKVPVLRSLRLVQEGEAAPFDDATVRASLPAAVRDLNIGAFVIFDFPERDYTVDYLQRVAQVQGQRQAACTVFDVRAMRVSALGQAPGADSLY
jgi:hypothetical protein